MFKKTTILFSNDNWKDFKFDYNYLMVVIRINYEFVLTKKKKKITITWNKRFLSSILGRTPGVKNHCLASCFLAKMRVVKISSLFFSLHCQAHTAILSYLSHPLTCRILYWWPRNLKCCQNCWSFQSGRWHSLRLLDSCRFISVR